MIRNALATTGGQADYWSHLKAMDYALERALAAHAAAPLDPLDRERLAALAAFLRVHAVAGTADPVLTLRDHLLRHVESRAERVPDVDVRDLVREVLEAQEWQGRRVTTDGKVLRLVDALERYLADRSGRLFPDPPRWEFGLLRAALGGLLRSAQSALHV